MSNIFLTGVTGFVGSFVAKKLVAQNHQIYSLVRETSDLRWIKNLPLKMVRGTLKETANYKETLRDVDYVFHIAGTTKASKTSEFYQGNVVGTEMLLNTVKEINPELKRFVLVSSQAAVGPSPTANPIDESFSCNPLTDYGISKLQAEEMLRTQCDNIPYTILRPPAVYGPRDTDVYNIFKNIKMGVNLQVGMAEQTVSIIYVEDLADGIIQAAFSPNSINETYFICEENAFQWSEFCRVISEFMNKKYRTIIIPYFLAFGIAGLIEFYSKIRKKPSILNRQKMREVKQPFWTISCEKAKNDFNYQTNFPLRKGIQKTIEWYRKEKWL